MNRELDLNDRNAILVMLMQSLWGAISPNFRLVAVNLESQAWRVLFVLEHEDATDREEIEDASAQFGALLGTGAVEYRVEVVVSPTPLAWPDSPWVVVFRRRETT